MWRFEIPRSRLSDAGKVEVIARNQCGEAYASTTLAVSPRRDDYRAVLRHNVKREFTSQHCRAGRGGGQRWAKFSILGIENHTCEESVLLKTNLT